LWNKVIKEHLGQLEEGLGVVATAMDVCADIVTGKKLAAIAELAAAAPTAGWWLTLESGRAHGHRTRSPARHQRIRVRHAG
jgi:hypothetical protein